MRLIAVFVGAITVSACGENRTPVAPSSPPPVVEACVTNRTGTVTFANLGSRTIDVFWNNAVLTTLTPGQTSQPFTVVAGGAQYVFDAVLTNSSFRPCQPLLATPVQCQNNHYRTCVF